MDDQEIRQEELLAMDSIYGHDSVFMADEVKMTGVISVPIELENDIAITPAETGKDALLVRHLPPVCLEFSLPAGYPSGEPPSIRVICNWLTPSQMLKIWRHLIEMWRLNEGNIVLFEYTEFLRADLVTFLQLDGQLDIKFFVERSRAHSQQTGASTTTAKTAERPAEPKPPERTCSPRYASSVDQLRAHYQLTLPPAASVHHVLAAYHKQAEQAAFRRRRFVCKVCGDDRAGADCVRLSQCGHVYCRGCLTAFYTVLIRDGEVQNLRCPEEQCTEHAAPWEVHDLVGSDLFERYDSLLLKTSLSSMSDVVTCPRLHCQNAVVLDINDNMGRCVHCEHVFCAICQNAYHGNNPCSIKSGERILLMEKYQSGSAAERASLEQRYGRRQLQKIVEEVQSVAWMSDHSERCPRCRTPIEKIDGCNKMSCTKCGTLFCWQCNSRLSRDNPYTHFNQPGTQCYGALFAGTVDAALLHDQLDDRLDQLAFEQPEQLALDQLDDDWVPMGYFL